jgi:hypothetical protein
VDIFGVFLCLFSDYKKTFIFAGTVLFFPFLLVLVVFLLLILSLSPSLLLLLLLLPLSLLLLLSFSLSLLLLLLLLLLSRMLDFSRGATDDAVDNKWRGMRSIRQFGRGTSFECQLD